MDSILDKFSSQNYLRQFFCGVVFFVPFWLFPSEKLNSLLDGSPWQFPQYIVLAILAFIIGTIIYHVEKNVYSYGLQALFELWEKSKTWCIISFVIAAAIIGGIGYFFLCKFAWWSIFFLIVPIILMILIICMRETILQRTQIAWAIEGGCENVTCTNMDQDCPMDDKARKAIADKVAKWSDFIHCAQSCCFAWLLGVIIIFWRQGAFSSDISWGNIISMSHGIELVSSCGIAAVLLVFEALFDWHRYCHVIAMTKGEYTKEGRSAKRLRSIICHLTIICRPKSSAKRLSKASERPEKATEQPNKATHDVKESAGE